MRLSTTTALGLSALTILALTGCSTGSTPSDHPTASASAYPGAKNSAVPAPLSSVALSKRLLDESDLGEGYTRKAQRPARHDVTVIGCPALQGLGSDAATGSGLSFPRTAKTSFTYTGGSVGSEVGEELYSDTATKLSTGVGQIFEAMTSCRTYQVLIGSNSLAVTAQKVSAPELGDERWSQLLTFTAGGRSSVVKQTAVRAGRVLAVISGSPALVDAHVDKALDKARSAR
ncbi:dsRNA-binding motif domain-containing protein [Streptomyces violascens]|uniref:hypothetical protein n=1 Tax=Streptomyces violascens TaxID=67381 RepID=UPI0036903BEE